jgi:hypothetical protein
MDLELTPAEFEQFRDALLSAFPSRGDLEQLVYFRLEVPLNQIVGGGNYRDVVKDLIVWANGQGKVDKLLTEARKVNRGNHKLRQFEEQIREAKSSLTQSGPALVYGKGRHWAVIVGVNDYEDTDNYGQLSVCVKDAKAVYQQLIVSGFESGAIRLLADDIDDTQKLPYKVNILKTLTSVAKATEPDDVLVFYYSGHGDEDENQGYLVVRDGHLPVLKDTAVPIARVKEIMESAHARGKVIVLDACHSGARIGAKGPKPMSAEFKRRVFEQAEGLAILASCTQGQLSYEWQAHERSVFTYYLLEALKGEADRDQKGFVTVQDANRHVVDSVKFWAVQHNRVQTPTAEVKVIGDIILCHYALAQV